MQIASREGTRGRDALAVRARDTIHPIIREREVWALDEGAQRGKIESALQSVCVVRNGVDNFDNERRRLRYAGCAHEVEFRDANCVEVDIRQCVTDTDLRNAARRSENRVRHALGRRPAVRRVVLYTKVFVRPAGIVRRCENDTAIRDAALALANHARNSWRREEACERTVSGQGREEVEIWERRRRARRSRRSGTRPPRRTTFANPDATNAVRGRDFDYDLDRLSRPEPPVARDDESRTRCLGRREHVEN